jgi:hypothetical protein
VQLVAVQLLLPASPPPTPSEIVPAAPPPGAAPVAPPAVLALPAVLGLGRFGDASPAGLQAAMPAKTAKAAKPSATS